MTTKQTRCPSCESGRFVVECCSGAGGCSCKGDVVDLGPCLVCKGEGWVGKEGTFDPMANRRSIEGLHFIGTGPKGMHGIWPYRGGVR